jgi:hypothetical protein
VHDEGLILRFDTDPMEGSVRRDVEVVRQRVRASDLLLDPGEKAVERGGRLRVGIEEPASSQFRQA